jgi:beta-phosphoglucomutase-like phosphatase (HAD superfamily)
MRNLEQRNLVDVFDGVWTADDVERAKPYPDLYELAALKLGVRPADCIVIEDSPNGVLAARRAGMFTIVTPHSLTEQMDLSDAHLRLNSLSEMPLGRLLDFVGEQNC